MGGLKREMRKILGVYNLVPELAWQAWGPELKSQNQEKTNQTNKKKNQTKPKPNHTLNS